MTLPIYLDPSFSDALTMYGGDTVPYEALVWQRFVAVNDIDTSQPLTESQKGNFSQFMLRYQAWDLGVPALTSPIPERYDYQKYYDIASNVLDAMNISPPPSSVEIRDMWRAFLYSKGYTSPPSLSIDFSNAFSAYVQGLGEKALSFDWSQSVTDPDKIPQIQLWNRFLEIYGIASTDQSSADVKAQFKLFLQRYNMWGVSSAILQSTNSLPPSSDANSELMLDYMNAFYGDLSTQEKTDLWNTFLRTQGLNSNPSSLGNLQEKFVSYINFLRSREQSVEAFTSISPVEAQRRIIFNTTMSGLSSMLQRSQDVVSAYSAALMIYGNWQKEYTTMMGRVPNISPIKEEDMNKSADTTLRLPSGTDPTQWNLADYTFGYGKISLDDVVNWAVYKLADPQLPLGNTVTFDPNPTGSDKKTGIYSFTISADDSGAKTIVAKYSNPVQGVAETTSSSVTLVDSNGSRIDTTTLVTNVETAYKQLFNTLFTNHPTLRTYLSGSESNGYLPAIQGRYLDTTPITYNDKDGNPVTDSTQIQKRTEQNAVLQQYVEGIKSNRDALQTKMTQMQNVLAGSRDSIDSISDLWTSIIETMDTIVQAIFKHSRRS